MMPGRIGIPVVRPPFSGGRLFADGWRYAMGSALTSLSGTLLWVAGTVLGCYAIYLGLMQEALQALQPLALPILLGQMPTEEQVMRLLGPYREQLILAALLIPFASHLAYAGLPTMLLLRGRGLPVGVSAMVPPLRSWPALLIGGGVLYLIVGAALSYLGLFALPLLAVIAVWPIVAVDGNRGPAAALGSLWQMLRSGVLGSSLLAYFYWGLIFAGAMIVGLIVFYSMSMMVPPERVGLFAGIVFGGILLPMTAWWAGIAAATYEAMLGAGRDAGLPAAWETVLPEDPSEWAEGENPESSELPRSADRLTRHPSAGPEGPGRPTRGSE